MHRVAADVDLVGWRGYQIAGTPKYVVQVNVSHGVARDGSRWPARKQQPTGRAEDMQRTAFKTRAFPGGLAPRGCSSAAATQRASVDWLLDTCRCCGCCCCDCCCCWGGLAGGAAVPCAPRSSVWMAACSAGAARATAAARCRAPSSMCARSASDTRSSSSLPAASLRAGLREAVSVGETQRHNRRAVTQCASLHESQSDSIRGLWLRKKPAARQNSRLLGTHALATWRKAIARPCCAA
jgi:hypothetical protein